MEMIFIKDLLSDKMESIESLSDKKILKDLINRLLNSYSTTPLNVKHAQRMLSFSENRVIYNTVLEVVKQYKIWELYSYKNDPNGLRFYDVVGYFYMITLLLCNMSEEAEKVIAEIVSKIDHQYDFDIMLRTLGFFKDEKIIVLKNSLENRVSDIKLK